MWASSGQPQTRVGALHAITNPRALTADRNRGPFTSAAEDGAPAITGMTEFSRAAGEYRITADAHDHSRFGYSLRDVDAVTGTDTTFSADSVWVGSFSGTCGEYLVQPRPQAATGDDWSGVIRYNGGNMAAGSKKTWKVTYRFQ